MGDIGLGVGMFTAIVLVLVVIILLARAQLVSTGNDNIEQLCKDAIEFKVKRVVTANKNCKK